MRTPLTHLRGQLEELLATRGPIATEQAEEAIEKCDDILRLFAAILRISELEAGELSRYFKPVDLAELVLETRRDPRTAGRGKQSCPRGFDTGDGSRSSWRSELLAQALINLIENALHHTPPGSRLRSRRGVGGHSIPPRSRQWTWHLAGGSPARDRTFCQARCRADHAGQWPWPQPRESDCRRPWRAARAERRRARARGHDDFRRGRRMRAAVAAALCCSAAVRATPRSRWHPADGASDAGGQSVLEQQAGAIERPWLEPVDGRPVRAADAGCDRRAGGGQQSRPGRPARPRRRCPTRRSSPPGCCPIRRFRSASARC